jgi:hypothetical protein
VRLHAAALALVLAGSVGADPVAFDARVIQLDVKSAGQEITIAAGADRGVTLGWHANLLRKADELGPEAKILRVTPKLTIAVLDLALDHVPSLSRVRLSPP